MKSIAINCGQYDAACGGFGTPLVLPDSVLEDFY